MRRLAVILSFMLSTTALASSQTVPLKPELAGIAFLVGSWGSGRGQVADTGGTSSGHSTITVEAGGSALLRRDHTDLFGADGKATGGFDQIMLIYPESGTLHADYSDGEHVIHYTSAVVVPGHSVAFTSATAAGSPTFRLSYETAGADALSVRFEMAPPGQITFHAIATGTLRR